MSVLNRILKTKQEEVTERKNRISERDLMSTLLAGRQRLSMRKALEESATGIIAEFKRKSPSGGFIHEAAGVQEVVGGYVRNGAAACSVLTDTDYFGGSLLDLAMARFRIFPYCVRILSSIPINWPKRWLMEPMPFC